ncbi:hypothetical protein D3C86_2180030 [compost metagenome]
MTDLPTARVQAWKESHRLLPVSLSGHILTVLGDITDEEVRMIEHHEILLTL